MLQSGADVLLQVDRDGAAVGQTYQTLINFKSHVIADFVTANFSPLYQTNGGGINGQTINGTAAGETLTGTIGDDVINGGDGNDTLIGGNGNDLLDGGNGADNLQGSFGTDRLIGGAGNDTLTGGGGSDSFEYSAVTDGADTVTDFTKTAGDVLKLTDLLGTFTGITPGTHANAFSGGYLQFVDSNGATAGGDTLVQVDSDGGGNSFVTLATLTNVLLTQADTANYLL